MDSFKTIVSSCVYILNFSCVPYILNAKGRPFFKYLVANVNYIEQDPIHTWRNSGHRPKQTLPPTPATGTQFLFRKK
jgi:hypothetical protein